MRWCLQGLEVLLLLSALVRFDLKLIARSSQTALIYQVSINPDMALSEALGKSWDVVVLPGGGPGAAALAASPEVISSSSCSKLCFEFSNKNIILCVFSRTNQVIYQVGLGWTFILTQ